jgi:P27 family predicted phage terminase small subunit
MGIVDIIDRANLEALCMSYQRMMEARLAIAEDGPFSTGSMGQLVEHPALKIEREAQRDFLRFSEHYALTPIARTRLGLAEIARRTMQEELRERIGRRPIGKT